MTGDTTVKVCRRRRFSAQGLVGLADQPRSGRPSAITPRQRAQIVGNEKGTTSKEIHPGNHPPRPLPQLRAVPQARMIEP